MEENRHIRNRLSINDLVYTEDGSEFNGSFSMALNDTVLQLNSLLAEVVEDLGKVNRGNKSAAQRVRVGTIDLEKIAKRFRKESVAAEKSGRFKKKLVHKKKKKKR